MKSLKLHNTDHRMFWCLDKVYKYTFCLRKMPMGMHNGYMDKMQSVWSIPVQVAIHYLSLSHDFFAFIFRPSFVSTLHYKHLTLTVLNCFSLPVLLSGVDFVFNIESHVFFICIASLSDFKTACNLSEYWLKKFWILIVEMHVTSFSKGWYWRWYF